MNNVSLIGRLTKDPESVATQSGNHFCRFTLAVDRRVKQGEEKQADFIPCKAFGKTADTLCQYKHKGDQIGLEGRIQTGSYLKDGKTVYTTDVVATSITFIGSRAQGNAQQAQTGYGQANPYATQYSQPAPSYGAPPDQEFSISGDDLPF